MSDPQAAPYGSVATGGSTWMPLDPSASTKRDFESFYTAEHEGQSRRAYLLLGRLDEAEEVVQDSFVEVYRRWSSLDDPGSYLNRVVLNGCRDAYRRRKRLTELVTRLRVDALGRHEAPSEPLTDALATLPYKQRAAIVLRFYSDLSTEEIASTMDVPVGSVGPWIDRGIRRLKRKFHD